METNLLTAQASIQVLKPVAEVFELIVSRDGMTNFWINKSSGRMEEGATLMWGFPEFEEQFPIKVGKIIKNELVSFYWYTEEGKEHEVSFEFKPFKGNATVLYIKEKDEPNTPEGLKWLKGNTEGWANFAASLKAWAEYGINIRKGAFDYRFE